ncbi:unnamed protein product, partial [Ectocarpus fasciculatus]
SRKRQRFRSVVAAAVSLILALAVLPIILTAPAAPATPLPPLAAALPADLDSGGVADPGAPAASAPGVARRAVVGAAAVAGGSTSTSTSTSSGDSDYHESRQGVDGPESWRRKQEEAG